MAQRCDAKCARCLTAVELQTLHLQCAGMGTGGTQLVHCLRFGKKVKMRSVELDGL